MENQHQRWVNLSYLAVAALVSFLFFSFSTWLGVQFDLETKIKSLELTVRIAAIVVGALVFFILSRQPKANQFMNEAVTELMRVTWPTQKETSSATFLVVIMVVVAGLLLGFLDYFWTKVIQWIL